MLNQEFKKKISKRLSEQIWTTKNKKRKIRIFKPQKCVMSYRIQAQVEGQDI